MDFPATVFFVGGISLIFALLKLLESLLTVGPYWLLDFPAIPEGGGWVSKSTNRKLPIAFFGFGWSWQREDLLPFSNYYYLVY